MTPSTVPVTVAVMQKRTARRKKRPKKDAAQSALSVVEQAIGGKLVDTAKSKGRSGKRRR